VEILDMPGGTIQQVRDAVDIGQKRVGIDG
jgi:hypothetical protein